MYNYGLIGNMSSAALVGTDGSIDWCCFPRFDSPSVFAAILDPDVGGHFRIGPTGTIIETRQEYVADTNVLQTTFRTASGIVSVTDFMPAPADHDDNPETPPEAPYEIHRIVTCLVGNMELRCDFQPRHDYARTVPSFRLLSGDSSGAAVQARGGRQTMTLLADIPLPFDDRGVVCISPSQKDKQSPSCCRTGTGARPAWDGGAPPRNSTTRNDTGVGWWPE